MSADQIAPEHPVVKPQHEAKSRAGWIATLFVLALVGWMGSGYRYPGAQATLEPPRETTRDPNGGGDDRGLASQNWRAL